ncbi:MAG: response regulator receiver protein [Desulfobulbus propionicus]|nr:MAG: response regulator receiver protein [Desulfobulbus propionicus]
MADFAQMKIDGFSLDNILQIFLMEKKSQSLEVRHDGGVGFLDVYQGELVNANTGNLIGKEAALEILGWENVEVQLMPLFEVEQTINATLVNILLEASKRKNDRQNALEISGEACLEAAVKQAEAHQYKDAHGNLVAYLKHNRNSARGWLWYSRVQGNLSAIKKSLDLAQSTAPEDPDINEEVHKFTLTSSLVKNGRVRKCFFCWALLNKGENRCHFCQAYLTVSQESLTSRNEVPPRYLKEGLDRYLRVLKSQPRHIVATYCLALIQLNSGNLEEALGYLDRVAKIAPDKAFFSNQLKLLMTYLVRVETVNNAPEELSEPEPEREEELGKVQKTILVIEDSSTTRKVICIALSRKGYKVIEAENGLEALSKISEERPHLIMLDVILPKMDGYKILSIVKGNREFKDIPVIMLTSKDGLINKMKGRMGGSAAYLTKPFDPDEMIEEIEKHL